MYIYLNHCTIWYDIINFAYFQGGNPRAPTPLYETLLLFGCMKV